MSITIIGIDCAVNEKDIGVAVGNYSDGTCSVLPLPNQDYARPISEFVCDWIKRSKQTLLALDAPLGWPCALGKTLVGHVAGAGIDIPSEFLFRRATDRFVKSQFEKQPLDVGADRIARTARAALELLEKIRQETGLEIPIAWTSGYTGKAAAIEVYPAGSLISHGLPASGYKKKDQISVRRQILRGLKSLIQLDINLTLEETNPDILDAIVCVLAGSDFLAGYALPPVDLDDAKKEGWIWIRGFKRT